ncbi:MAG: 16S rRNA (cytidine(1402)-2'-O)-methyltransferase [Zoogloeaceae bacterium]|jgi:16S rRNA (cytidine1402-2'-O)-methyltransferase|nr:16S rRNA (cytidine(1402)-2'-O)-methyltransferase [Zoogloeaceae bacterium]
MTIEYAPLYVVPTPLGNLADISERARDALRAVFWVAAEDTRHSAPLLRHIGAKARLLPAHAHNENAAAQRVLAILARGESVALISDAGTPGISDPGARIVAHAHAAGARVIPLPGPCAAVTALSAAGFSEAQWLFFGFLPARSGQRRAALKTIAALPCALAFYEAPHRILESLTDMAEELGETRALLIAREISKQFETLQRLLLGEAAAWIAADPMRQKGEFTLIVSGATVSPADEGERLLRLFLAENLPIKQASKLAATLSGHSKNALYAQALEIRRQRTEQRTEKLPAGYESKLLRRFAPRF